MTPSCLLHTIQHFMSVSQSLSQPPIRPLMHLQLPFIHFNHKDQFSLWLNPACPSPRILSSSSAFVLLLPLGLTGPHLPSFCPHQPHLRVSPHPPSPLSLLCIASHVALNDPRLLSRKRTLQDSLMELVNICSVGEFYVELP